jgi:uncharacterized membrane protein (DUF106 family)
MDKASMRPLMITMLIVFSILFLWNTFPIIKNSATTVLNPSVGALINWNNTFGMMILVFIIALITTLVQKYATDQETLKQIKKEQKEIRKEMQKYKNHPEKMLEINKKNMEFVGKTMKLTMKGNLITVIPFGLLFMWFRDFFPLIGSPKLLGIFSWFWFYFVFTMIFSVALRKAMKVY